MADWQAFATAFLNDTAGYINKRTEKASDFADEQRAMKEKSIQRLSRRKQMMDAAQSITNRLKEQGASEELIRSALSAGPTGLTDLDRKFQAAVTQFGPDFASSNPELVSELFSTSATPEALGMTGDNKTTLDDFMRETYGLAAPTTGSYEAQDVGFFGRLMGRGAMDRARAQLDREMGGEGYSVYDLNQAAQASEYQSLVPGANVQYGTANMFTAESMVDESVEYSRRLKLLESTDQYATLAAEAQQLTAAIAKDAPVVDAESAKPETVRQHAENQARLDMIRQQMRGMRVEAIGDVVEQRRGAFWDNSYLDVMGNTIDSMIGDPTYTTSLRQADQERVSSTEQGAPVGRDSSAMPPEMEQGVSPPSEIRTEVLPEQNVISDPNVLGGTPVAKTLDEAGNPALRLMAPMQGPDGEQYPVGFIIPSDASARLLERLEKEPSEITAEDVVTVEEDLGVVPVTREEYDSMSKAEKRELGLRYSGLGGAIEGSTTEFLAPSFAPSAEFKANADPEAFYEVYMPQFASGSRTYLVKGSDLQFIPDSALASERSTVMINGLAMEDSDLRTISGKRIRRKFGTSEAAEPVSTEPTDSAVETSGRPAQRPEGSAENFYEQLDNTVEADPMSDALLRASATDMVGYLKEKGIAKDADAATMIAALAEWADKNNKMLPADKSVLLYAMRFGLNL